MRCAADVCAAQPNNRRCRPQVIADEPCRTALHYQFDRFAELTDDLSTRMPLDHAKLLAPKATMLEPQTCGGEG